MFGNMLMVSVQSAPMSLEQTLLLAFCHQGKKPQPVYIRTGALALYKQTAPVARGLIRRRATNPIKSQSVPSLGVCLKTGRVTTREVTGSLSSSFPCQFLLHLCS